MTRYCARCKKRVRGKVGTGTRRTGTECGRSWGTPHRGRMKW